MYIMILYTKIIFFLILLIICFSKYILYVFIEDHLIFYDLKHCAGDRPIVIYSSTSQYSRKKIIKNLILLSKSIKNMNIDN